MAGRRSDAGHRAEIALLAAALAKKARTLNSAQKKLLFNNTTLTATWPLTVEEQQALVEFAKGEGLSGWSEE